MDPITIALGLAKLTGLDKKIGSWIGGDNGAAVASKVVDIAQTYTNSDSPELALAAIEKDVSLTRDLKMAIMQQAKELEELSLKNTQSARDMQHVALQQDDKFSKRFIYYFAGFWSLFAVIYIACITFIDIPETSTRFADTILGFLLGTVVATIVNFFYGSSSGNEKRAEKVDLKDMLGR